MLINDPEKETNRRSSSVAANPNLIYSDKDTDMSHNRAKYTVRVVYKPAETGITVSEKAETKLYNMYVTEYVRADSGAVKYSNILIFSASILKYGCLLVQATFLH